MEENNNTPSLQVNDQGKIVAILSYCTLIGLIIALVLNADTKNKSELGIFHLRQALGLYITGFSMMIASIILVFIPILGWILAILINLCYIGLLVFLILGIISAINSEKKALPLVGSFYQNLLKGIS